LSRPLMVNLSPSFKCNMRHFIAKMEVNGIIKQLSSGRLN